MMCLYLDKCAAPWGLKHPERKHYKGLKKVLCLFVFVFLSVVVIAALFQVFLTLHLPGPLVGG